MRILLFILCLAPAILFAQERVGINTSAPESDLDIRGTDDEWDGGELQLATPTESNFLRFFGGRLGDPNPFIAFTDTDTFHIVSTSEDWLTFTRRMSLWPNGNVGIGTDAPLAKLDISAPGDSSSILRLGTDRPWAFKQYGGGPFTVLALQSEVPDKSFDIMSPGGNRTASFFTNDNFSRILFSPDTTNAVVGIGLPFPQAKLHIKHNSSSSSSQIELTEDDDDYARVNFTSIPNPGARWNIAGQADTLAADSRLNFYYSGPEGFGDRVTIRGNGNVGIQNFSPVATLDIKGGRWNLDGGNEGDVRIGSATNNLRIGVATGGGGAGLSRIYSTIGLWLGTAGSPDLSIDSDGDVGIGTTNPQEKLHVSGNMRLTGAVIGPDNNGISSALKIQSTGTGQIMLIDGNEIDVIAGGQLALNGNSNFPVTIGGGTIASGYSLCVSGKIIAEEVRVQLEGAWPDYVFEEGYDLKSLDDLEASIRDLGHLPGIPSAKTVEDEGIALGDMQKKLLEKIEELTLYTIEQEKRIQQLEELLLDKSK